MFREAPLPNGSKGPVSYRRVAAAVTLLASFAAFGAGLQILSTLPASVPGWVAMVPGAALLVASILMPILTTICDVQAIIHAALGKSAPAGSSPPAKDGT